MKKMILWITFGSKFAILFLCCQQSTLPTSTYTTVRNKQR